MYHIAYLGEHQGGFSAFVFDVTTNTEAPPAFVHPAYPLLNITHDRWANRVYAPKNVSLQ